MAPPKMKPFSKYKPIFAKSANPLYPPFLANNQLAFASYVATQTQTHKQWAYTGAPNKLVPSEKLWLGSKSLRNTQKVYESMLLNRPGFKMPAAIGYKSGGFAALSPQLQKQAMFRVSTISAGAGNKPTKQKMVHPQPWRILPSMTQYGNQVAGPFAHLGSATPMPHDMVFEVHINQTAVEQLLPGPLAFRYLSIQYLQNAVFAPVRAYMSNLIHSLVPLRKGTLRQAYQESISPEYTPGGQSRIMDWPAYMQFNAGMLEYSRPVNNMPSSSLKRSGKAPLAIYHHYEYILEHGQQMAKHLFNASFKSHIKAMPEIANAVAKIGKYGYSSETLFRMIFGDPFRGY